MNRKILLACSAVPGSGGANTAGYRLFQMLCADGIDAAYVNLIEPHRADYFRNTFGERVGNPKALDNVHNCFLTHPLYDPDPRHAQLVDVVARTGPDVMVGMDHIGALLLKHAAPDTPVVYLTAGCGQLLRRIKSGSARDAISFCRQMRTTKVKPELVQLREAETVERTDLILTHSTLNRDLYHFFFAERKEKIHPEVIWWADWICHEAREYAHLARPFEQRDMDVLFVANRWNRPEKNWPLVAQIIQGLPPHQVHLVGECEQVPAGIRHHGFVSDRETLFSFFGRTRVVVSASSVDAAPGILFEAAVLGANVVASRNCGNWRLCHDSLLVRRYRAADFIQSIGRALEKKLPDHLDDFLQARSYEKLVETLAVV